MKETHFSRERVCKVGELIHRKFETTRPQFSRKSNPIAFVEDWQSRTGSNCGRSFCIQCSVDSPTSLALVGAKFTTRETRADIIPDRNAKWNRKFPEFPNFQKKGQPREVDRSFRNEFPEIFCSIRFWTGIFGNFGQMERAQYLYFFQSCSSGTISLYHSFTPSPLHFPLDIWKPGGSSHMKRHHMKIWI